MSDWNYGELINRRPHSHSVASNSTQPMETELSREREAHNKTKRERDEAREELRTAVQERHDFHWELQDAIRERNEAREGLEEEKKFHHRTHAELIQTQCRLMDMTQAIILTLEENRHLADGDDCTLAKLKSAVPNWK